MTRARDVANIDGVLTTKGDIYAATAASTPARLGVGNNGETLVADSSTSTGLRYQGSMAAGRNFVINGGFDIWQRGTSFASTNGYYADRWTNTAEQNAVTATRQSSGAPDGSQYYLRLTSTGAASYWTNFSFIETSNCAALWGKTVTLSVKLRKNATANNTGMTLFLQKSATVDAGSGASWAGVGSSNNIPLASLPTGTTSADWFLATVTATVPNDGTANSLRVGVSYNGGTASGSVFDVAQVMLEVGSVPTQFSRAGGTIQGELAACQRYYWRTTNVAAATYAFFGYGLGSSTTNVAYAINYPVIMRIVPTSVDGGNLATYRPGATTSISAVAIDGGVSTNQIAGINATTTGVTSGTFYQLAANNSTAAYLGFSAEL